MRKSFMLFGVLIIRGVSFAVPPQQEPLIHKSNLTYLGAFKVPLGPLPNSQFGFDYAAAGLAYNPANNSLFLNTSENEQKTGEISIPVPSTDFNNLPRANLLQIPADITEGNRTHIYPNGTANTANKTLLGGLFVYNNRLIGDAYDYYDGNTQANLSHFAHSLTVSQTGTFRGMYKVDSVGPNSGFLGLNPGFYNGGMALVPPQWRPLLNGPALTGQCCLAVIGRSSLGPAAFVFDPDQIVGVVTSTVPATPLVYYDANHPTLGIWDNKTTVNPYYNMTTVQAGMVFPEGTRSVLFFGRQGGTVKPPCYGQGTNDPALDQQPVPGVQNVIYCYDPANFGPGSKGGHGYPYKYWVWAYDANDLLAVKNKQKNPWEILPYATWELRPPISPWVTDIQGVAYDPATQKIYVALMYVEGILPGADLYNRNPIIEVYQINNAPPPTFSPCDVNKDATTNVADAQLEANMAIKVTSCTSDINLDGKCDVTDVQRVVVAALGGACVSP